MDARPDQEGMEQAINKCQLNPCSGQESVSLISVTEAMAAGFLPALDEDQADMFTPLELLLYRHAQDHRLLTGDILGYPSVFGDILG